MNAIEKAQELYEKHQKLPCRLLYLAYIQLCMENPTLHPDDHLRVDGGYKGYQALLVHDVFSLKQSDNLRYPHEFLKLDACLETVDDPDLEDAVQDVRDFITFPDTKSMHTVIEALEKLYLSLSDEDLSGEEEEDMPAGIFNTCCNILRFVATDR